MTRLEQIALDKAAEVEMLELMRECQKSFVLSMESRNIHSGFSFVYTNGEEYTLFIHEREGEKLAWILKSDGMLPKTVAEPEMAEIMGWLLEEAE